MSDLDKPALRRGARAFRERQASAFPDAANLAAAHALSALAPAPGQVVSAYIAMRGELDTLPLIGGLVARGAVTALPCVSMVRKHLIFRRWSPGEPLVEAAHGTREPPAEAPEVVPSVLFLPLLAYDGDGVRLGYGGGYFDRTLASLRAADPALRAFGYAYHFQRLDRLPREAHDELLDGVVTDSGLELFSRTQELE